MGDSRETADGRHVYTRQIINNPNDSTVIIVQQKSRQRIGSSSKPQKQ